MFVWKIIFALLPKHRLHNNRFDMSEFICLIWALGVSFYICSHVSYYYYTQIFLGAKLSDKLIQFWTISKCIKSFLKVAILKNTDNEFYIHPNILISCQVVQNKKIPAIICWQLDSCQPAANLKKLTALSRPFKRNSLQNVCFICLVVYLKWNCSISNYKRSCCLLKPACPNHF